MSTPTETPPAAATLSPQDQMVALIEFLRDTQSAAGFHFGIDTGDGVNSMGDLFDKPLDLLAYIRGATGQTGAAAGKPLVVAGQPENSAFYQLVTKTTHPMFSKFKLVVPILGKAGVEVVEQWIKSL